eukprot:1733892-Pyramimonas_sp.AAC.1
MALPSSPENARVNHLGSGWTGLEAILDPSWGALGLSWGRLGGLGGCVWAILDHPGRFSRAGQ